MATITRTSKAVSPTLTAPARTRKGPRLAPLYIGLVLLVELIIIGVSPVYGLVLDAFLLALFLFLALRAGSQKQQRVPLALALVTFIRLITVTLPITSFPTLYWPLVIGAPLCLAIYFILQTTGLSPAEIGLRAGSAWLQMLVGLSGIVLGYDEYLILHTAPLVRPPSWALVVLTAPILLLFSGMLEELLFRGVLQTIFRSAYGKLGSLVVVLLFALIRSASHIPLDILFTVIVGLYFSFVAARTRSIMGVILAHGLWNLTLYLVFPLLIGR